MPCSPGCPSCPPEKIVTRASFEESWTPLKAAEDVTAGDRQRDYGPPAENHARTATLWSAYLHARGYPAALSAADVCWLNVLQKCSREMNRHKPDNIVDSIGYLLNVQEIEDT